jgi:hypothetical protein
LHYLGAGEEVMTKWKVVYESKDIVVDAAIDVCQVCKLTTDVLGIDCSEHEYLSFVCCGPCFTKLIEKARIK